MSETKGRRRMRSLHEKRRQSKGAANSPLVSILFYSGLSGLDGTNPMGENNLLYSAYWSHPETPSCTHPEKRSTRYLVPRGPGRLTHKTSHHRSPLKTPFPLKTTALLDVCRPPSSFHAAKVALVLVRPAWPGAPAQGSDGFSPGEGPCTVSIFLTFPSQGSEASPKLIWESLNLLVSGLPWSRKWLMEEHKRNVTLVDGWGWAARRVWHTDKPVQCS